MCPCHPGNRARGPVSLSPLPAPTHTTWLHGEFLLTGWMGIPLNVLDLADEVVFVILPSPCLQPPPPGLPGLGHFGPGRWLGDGLARCCCGHQGPGWKRGLTEPKSGAQTSRPPGCWAWGPRNSAQPELPPFAPGSHWGAPRSTRHQRQPEPEVAWRAPRGVAGLLCAALCIGGVCCRSRPAGLGHVSGAAVAAGAGAARVARPSAPQPLSQSWWRCHGGRATD